MVISDLYVNAPLINCVPIDQIGEIDVLAVKKWPNWSIGPIDNRSTTVNKGKGRESRMHQNPRNKEEPLARGQ